MRVRGLKQPVTVVVAVACAALGMLAVAAPTARATGATVRATRTGTARAAVDPAALDIAARQHVSLAQAETRLSWQRRLPALAAAVARQLPAGKFGGIWIAPNNGDRVEVGVVGLDAHARAAVARAVRAAGLSAAADVVRSRYSLGQLVRADGWLGVQLDRLYRHATRAIHLSSDYRTDLNRVQLEVAGHTLTAAERALIARAKARYGGLVHVVTGPGTSAAGMPLDCTYPYCFPPLRGGIYITNTNSQGFQSQCTGSFIAASRVDGKLYQFTAGHCANEGIWLWTGTWTTNFPDGSTHAIGPVHHYVYDKSGDEAILAIDNPTGWQLPQGWVYVTKGPGTTLNERYPISSAQYSTQGQRICDSGAASGHTTCGVVTALGVNHRFCALLPTPSCTTVDNLGQTNICSVPGDSGAPLYAAHQAFGLMSGQWNRFTPCKTLYQGIISAENAMNVNIVLAH